MQPIRVWLATAFTFVAWGGILSAGDLEIHRDHLSQNVGRWEGTVKIWRSGPNEPPTVGTAVETTRSIGDNFWIVSDYEFQFDGRSASGSSQIGFDPLLKRIVGSIVDSGSPHLGFYRGEMNADGDKLTLIGEHFEPAHGKMAHRRIEILTDGDKKTMTVSIDRTGTGARFVKFLEATYTHHPTSEDQ